MPAEAHPFDRLVFDNDLWETDVYLSLFEATVRLTVYAEEEGPSPWQRALFERYLEREPVLKTAAYEALLAYYQSIVGDYRRRFSPNSLHLAPIVSSVQELRPLLQPEALLIADRDEVEQEVGLLFGCTWDPGHGIGVRIVADAVAEVGSQDVCL